MFFLFIIYPSYPFVSFTTRLRSPNHAAVNVLFQHITGGFERLFIKTNGYDG